MIVLKSSFTFAPLSLMFPPLTLNAPPLYAAVGVIFLPSKVIKELASALTVKVPPVMLNIEASVKFL